MAGEAVGERGRIKFQARRVGTFCLMAPLPAALEQLAALMHHLEACGMIPILDDGLVGGNCAISAAACGGEQGGSLGGLSGGDTAVLVSRSGKQPGAALQADDWVLLTGFDEGRWEAEFSSAQPDVRPTSDSPLLHAALGPGAAVRHGWRLQPMVAVHGHALADGQGLERARQAGLPISEHETLFSTPADLEALVALFRSHPYPSHRCFIRRGHGFLLLAQSVREAEEYLQCTILPLAALGRPS